MTNKQSLNLTASNFAAFQAIAETFKSVQHCQLISSRNIVGSVKEIVFQVTTPETTAEVAVWVIANGDKTYRNLFIAQKGQGESVMSTQNLKFDATKIEYGNPNPVEGETPEEARRRIKYGEEEARKFAPKNVRVCEDLNEGTRFAFYTDKYGVWAGSDEVFDTYYSFIVLEDGTFMPLPVFFAALDIDYVTQVGTLYEHEHEDGFRVIDAHEATEAQMVEYLQGLFGDQFIGAIADEDDLVVRRLVKIDGSDVTVVTDFDYWNPPAEAQGVPEYNPNLYDHLVDDKRVNRKWLEERIAQGNVPKLLAVQYGDSDYNRNFDLNSLKEVVGSA